MTTQSPMHPRIILLNFTEAERRTVASAGYDVERGFIGEYESSSSSRPSRLPFYSPHPLYEYDVLFYNSEYSEELEAEFTGPLRCRNLMNEEGSLEALKEKFTTPPHVRVSFIGRDRGYPTLLHAGLNFVKLIRAEENVSSFLESRNSGAFAIKEVHDLVAGFKSQISSVGQFFDFRDDPYPLYRFAVLLSRNGQRVAGYGTTFHDATVPRYVILPQLKSTARAVVQMLQCFEKVFPQLFPDKHKRNWLESEEFWLPEERIVRKEIEEKIEDSKKFIVEKKKQLDALAKEFGFVRGLLVATEGSKEEPSTRLSGVVRKALEFLEFKVEDIDEKTKGAIKKEDFWVIHGDFLAITEVTGTVNKNPKIKEFNDILGRMTTIYKRSGDLKLPANATVSGLLVLNYDIDNHPSKRPRVYTGEDEHIAEAAIDQGIGLLSTVELYKMVKAVKEGHLTRADARGILRKPGRIEYDPTRARPRESQQI